MTSRYVSEEFYDAPRTQKVQMVIYRTLFLIGFASIMIPVWLAARWIGSAVTRLIFGP